MEVLVVKMLPIVIYYKLWYSESTYYGLLDEVTYVVISDCSYCLILDSLGKIVDDHHKEFLVFLPKEGDPQYLFPIR